MVFGQGDFQLGEFVIPEKPISKKDILKEVKAKFANLPIVEYGKHLSVSYSQYSTFKQCPHKWYRSYVTKEIVQPPAIHFTFGTTIHEILQHWITIVYQDSLKEANKLDVPRLFKNALIQNYTNEAQKHKIHFSNPEELKLMYEQGLEVIKYFIKHRTNFFNTKSMELIGVEIPIFMNVSSDSLIKMVSYIDLVFYDVKDDQYVLFDIKTGKKGWSKYDKQNKLKTSQLLLYKYYFSLQYDIPIEKIRVEYILTKREVNIEREYPEKRITTFSPSQGKIAIKQTINEFNQFISQCFDSNTGVHKQENSYIAVGGVNFNNCRFCALKDNEQLCPKSNRICE